MTTTVSACCGAEVETRYSSFIDGNQYTCTKCRLVNCDVVERPTPTHSPTETVSDCNCIDCRVGRDLGLKPKLPHTEPTVEKSQDVLKKLRELDIVIDDNGKELFLNEDEVALGQIEKFIRHSVQEAKAEMIEKIIKYQNGWVKENGDIAPEFGVIDDLLAFLKQEEEK